MIFKLTNSNFSESNIGTLNSWRIIKSLQGVSTSSNIVSVAKDGSYSAVFTVLDGYTFNTASVTMGGTNLTSSLVWDADNKTANLSISKVTDNVYISISANRDSEEGEEVVRQRTIVYKYLTLSGQTIQASTYEKVNDGTFKTFDINNAPEIEGYEKVEVTPASATVTGNITVIYTYKSTQEEELIPVTGVTLDRATYTLEIEDSIQLYHTVLPSNASDTRVRWSTSNGCCTVVNGLVTAVRAGSCTITVTTVNGSFTDTCAITVNAASGGGEEEPDIPVDPAPDVPVDPNAATWYIEPTAISIFNSPSKTSAASFAYPINNALIGMPINAIRLAVAQAGILSYGKVSASEYTKLGTVTLENPSKETQIYMLEETFILGEEESIWFQATDDTGLFYYHSSAGKTVGDFKASIKGPVKVTSGLQENLSIDVGFVGSLDDIEVTGISISNPISSLLEGNTRQLIAKAIPSYAKLPQVKWTASNGNCTVTNNGLVTAVKAGSCTITVKTLDGSFQDSCTIKVYDIANSPSTWYVDGMAGLSRNTSVSTNSTASYAYKDEAINNAYRGQPINALRMSVAKAGTFTYGKVGASANDLYEVLGTIQFTEDDVCASCTVTQIFTIPTITLSETETLWVQARSTDKGLFYYGAGASYSPVLGYTGFRIGIYPGVSETSTGIVLGIDIGFINPNENIPVDCVLINQDYVNASIGETIQLTCTVFPKIATNKNVVWTSSDNVNCPVDNNGLVTVNAVGVYTITASATDGSGVKGECTINADDTTWYFDAATGPGTIAISSNTGGYAYANADEIATYIGKPINRIRLAVQKAGIFTYGKTDGTTRTVLGTLNLANPSQGLQIYQLNETITLAEGENLWFSDSTDTAKFYYKTGSAVGNFCSNVKDDSPAGGTKYSHNLAISIGYKA